MSTTVHGPGDTPAAAPPAAEPPIPAPDPDLPPAASGLTDHVEQTLQNQGVEVERTGPQSIMVNADQALFDGKPYESLKPNVDGEDTDSAKVTITGSWDIDLEDAADVAWFNRVMRGQSVDLRIEAECTDRTAPYKRNSETDETTITGVMKLKVTHVHRLTPEEL